MNLVPPRTRDANGFFVAVSAYPADRRKARSSSVSGASCWLRSWRNYSKIGLCRSQGASMETRQCKKCGQVKPVTEFHKAGFKNGVQQYRSACAACQITPATAERWILRSQGLKRCTECNEIKPFVEFYSDKRKQDGCKHICKKCFGATIVEYHKTERGYNVLMASKRRHRATEHWRETHRLYMKRVRDEGRYADHESARHAVNFAVQTGNLPSIHTRQCADCGKVAQEYHHESYERDRWLDVIPLCESCHTRRHKNE